MTLPQRKRLRRDPLRDPERLIERVYRYVAFRIGDGPDAEDVTSEAFTRAVRYRESYDPSKGSPAEWVIGIARRCLADVFSTSVAATELPDAIAPGNLEEDAIRRLTTRAAIAELGERDRELVALRYGADLSARQIGDLLGMKTNAVEVALHRALARMRASMSDEPRRAGDARFVEAAEEA
jgi:RNA polymerase sigma factor (sigma-70 family)